MTQEKKPHVHAELIKAWADGAEIQDWKGSFWQDCQYPTWNVFHLYRIKPEPMKTKRYRRWISKTNTSACVHTVCEGIGAPVEAIEGLQFFLRWIDEDWQEGVVVDA